MWLRYKYLILFILFVNNSCGFKPIYHKRENNEIATHFSQIKIETEKSEMGRDLANLLDKKFQNHGSKYLLNISIKNKIVPYSITKGVASRYGITIQAAYKLLDTTNNKLLTSGELMANSGFNLDKSEFINYQAEDYTNYHNLQNISDQIESRLTMYFLSKKHENSSK